MIGLQVVVLLGVCIVIGGSLAARLRLAPPLVWLVIGAAVGLPLGHRHIALPPEVVLLLFLPALLFWESLTTSLREIRANLRPVVLLAVGLVLTTATVVASVGHLFGLSWPVAFVLGAVVAPTDATAVAAVASRLPRRMLTTLRAESLINDGTALVIYGLAIGAATGHHRVGAIDVAVRFPLSYCGGLLIGLVVAVVVLAVLRRLHDPHLENVVSVLTPFLAYLPAEELGVSGVVAVVTCGLALSQTTPRVVGARTRVQSVAFWQTATYLLNASLFLLIGLQLPAVLAASDTDPVRAFALCAVVAAVVITTRLAWAYTVPYIIRALDRRPTQRPRRVGARQRLPFAWAGFRGAVSLAAALAVPETLPDRDSIVLATYGVILTTLLVQGLSMPAVVRWARLPADSTELEEQLVAEREATRVGLDVLDDRAAQLGTPQGIVEQVRQRYQQKLAQLPDQQAGDDNGDGQAEQRLLAALLDDRRAAVVRLRDLQHIDDTVLRRVQARLDNEELQLGASRREPDQP